MLKDVAHADVGKNDDIDETDPNYDDYYDVRQITKKVSQSDSLNLIVG